MQTIGAFVYCAYGEIFIHEIITCFIRRCFTAFCICPNGIFSACCYIAIIIYIRFRNSDAQNSITARIFLWPRRIWHWRFLDIYISIHTYGNTNIFFAGLITVLFVMILSVFIAVQSYCLKRYFPSEKSTTWLLAFPSTWVLSEWIRSWILSGFPWLLLGQSQTNSPLQGFSPIVGVYGVSFLVALSAALLFMILKLKRGLIWLSILLLILIWTGGFYLSKVQWTTVSSNPIRVTLIQGDIPQSIKWSPKEAINALTRYEKLTQAQHWQNQLIIWPETAVTLMLPDAVPLLGQIDKTAQQHQAAIITGIPIPQKDSSGNTNYYNGVIVLGNGNGQYFKRHLVPFGEYVPLESLIRGLIGFFDLPMSDFSEGPDKQPLLNAVNLKIAPYVCYEIAYTNLLRDDLPEANLLVGISNDTWFDHSAASAQQRQISQFAAQSTRRYMLVATNSGQTVIINPNGQIQSYIPSDEIGTLNGTVTGMTGTTPWIKLGNGPFIILFILILFFIRPKKNKK